MVIVVLNVMLLQACFKVRRRFADTPKGDRSSRPVSHFEASSARLASIRPASSQ